MIAEQLTFESIVEPPDRPHTCHARECEKTVKPELLMCGRHWRMVPRVIQRAVWDTYRPRPSAAWHKAASAAIGYVAHLEGRLITRAEREALAEFGQTP
jgi:hypothetical protein